ncbi:hypothetical protein VITU102760_25065 [Vibrio tubiashii]|uniref:Uncharacterized protein n=1 Tax=Vibrio tubiashii ATCC 19109 TaxID=1051646 RepID=F9T6U1_9VIBR|nr:hypothetical protein [Vibrio tubiashii]AIW17504.1 hypothetical protein IX91_25955 [Vibrio tubiashii ATCC 19109]EGU54496.1 hypothetical protein VITU9109_02942 [Vibrio tubiashii ATCC 19109]EIF01275.1 hypothetical protein VT1337_24355 [Vibrio tubiashii NCIMB 1337 = ATCC 19106]
MKKLLLLLSLPLVTTSAFADYKVTLDIEQPEKDPLTITEVVDANHMKEFSSVNSVEYVSAIETTTMWYHNLLGIEPAPKERLAEIEVGIRGYLKVSPTNNNSQMLIALDGQIVELLSMNTFEHDIVEFPYSQNSQVAITQVLELDNGVGCLKPFSAAKDYLFNVCIEKL